ncbi:MAG: hypothetical protein LRZ84_08360 [Desertifilum sp.]|nr:hypothetical protein [Desertifilum sp.]MDI9640519.1 hypothetical protein [Geitlerinema splendidum]
MINSQSLSEKILLSRSQYQPCHIQVPDLDKRLPAIQIGDRYYSLFKVETERDRALRVLEKLIARGDDARMVQGAKGYILWVWEPEAHPENFKNNTQSVVPKGTESLSFEQFPMLVSRSQYQPCHIRVPDLKHKLPAVQFEGAYYSLFRIEPDFKLALERIQALKQRNDKALVTPSPKGYVLWVLEPEAYLESL